MEIHWDQLGKPQWQGRVASQPTAALRQDWDFGVAMARLGVQTGRAVILDGRQEIAIAQVLQRRGLRVIGQGPLWLAPLDIGQKRRVVRSLARYCGATVVTPIEPMSGWGLLPLVTAKSSAIWPLDPPIDVLRSALHGKWRNRLLRAEDRVNPIRLRAKQVQNLVAQEATQRRVRGYRNLPGALAADWPGQVLALGWQANGAVQAGMVFLIHGHAASYFLGWASPLGREVFAHGPILWQAALALQNKGLRLLDLGDVDTETGAALARFKLGTGAGVCAAGATCLAVPI